MVIINDDGVETTIHHYPIARADLDALESFLRSSGCFGASFVDVDPYSASVYLEQYCRDETETTFYLDRNIFSQVLDLVGGHKVSDRNRLGASVMAFVACAESNVSASVAMFEGHLSGASRDWKEEKILFETATALSAREWASISLGYAESLKSAATMDRNGIMLPEGFDISRAQSPFGFVYPALLYVAILQRRGGSKAHRMSAFIRWVHERWLYSFPVLLFAMKTFSSKPFRGALKGIGSADPDRVLRGVRNAAWDLTHITHLFKETKSQSEQNRLSVFCSADKETVALADWLMPGMYGEDRYSDFMSQEFGQSITDLYWRLSRATDDMDRQANKWKGRTEEYGRTITTELESVLRST